MKRLAIILVFLGLIAPAGLASGMTLEAYCKVMERLGKTPCPVYDEKQFQQFLIELEKMVERYEKFKAYANAYWHELDPLKGLNVYSMDSERQWKVKLVGTGNPFGLAQPVVDAVNKGGENESDNARAGMVRWMYIPTGTPPGADEDAFQVAAASSQFNDALMTDALRTLGAWRNVNKNNYPELIRMLDQELINPQNHSEKQVDQKLVASKAVQADELNQTNRLLAQVVMLKLARIKDMRDGNAAYVTESQDLEEDWNTYRSLWEATDDGVLMSKP